MYEYETSKRAEAPPPNFFSGIYLQGHTLTLRVPYHADWGHEEWVVYDGGEIVRTPRGTVFYLR